MDVFKRPAPMGSPITEDTMVSKEALLGRSEELNRTTAFVSLEHRPMLALLSVFGNVCRENFRDLCLPMQL